MKTTNPIRLVGNSKPPRIAFQECPRCGHPHLNEIDSDVFCSMCGWDSFALSVDAGALDHLYSELWVDEHGHVRLGNQPRRGEQRLFALAANA